MDRAADPDEKLRQAEESSVLREQRIGQGSEGLRTKPDDKECSGEDVVNLAGGIPQGAAERLP